MEILGNGNRDLKIEEIKIISKNSQIKQKKC